MYITLEADYAVRITAELCKADGKLDAKTLSDKTGVTLRFSLKILRKLVSAGLVKSFKGTQGGYMIAKDPKDMTLRMVIEAIEGTYCFSRCLQPDADCNRGASGNCPFQDAFREITKMVSEKLDTYNFAQLNRSVEVTDEKETEKK
ncbi:Rrf2 family transcriptional regulator [uncultured Ruminococcus sp.]|uniref:RrF2 family transcriptional regulator n=1 Tax=uncultured Ruminococcus sp. TaxID=165186 RepID=UPI000ECB9283|nr:Rrf2 family transcriptional regulator [uncultured Ruminococcus sp.]HCJ41600.1 Rrf2 family transcriptional regulator [Ruminococcus sp.]